MNTTDFHTDRFVRMIRDLGITPASLMVDAELAIFDDAAGRRLTPPLGNQTLAEGLIAAIKLVVLAPRSGEDANRFGDPDV